MTTLSGPPVVSARNLLTAEQVGPALVESLKKLNARALVHQPVIFVVWVGSLFSTERELLVAKGCSSIQ